MTTKLPPQPIGVAPGHSFWNDWYEKLRRYIDSVDDSTGTGPIVRRTAATILSPSIDSPLITTGLTVEESFVQYPGISATVPLAKLTGLGTDGSMTFVYGILVAYTAPT